MPRPRKTTTELKKALNAAPRPLRDWSRIVNARTEDPEKRAALMFAMAQLDELVRAFREKALKGVAAAGRLLLDYEKQRARLLGLTAAELADEEGNNPDDIDVPDWTPSTPKARARPPKDETE